ncbi:transmembrane protein 267 [Tribolium madens]|uniref:transmembrane protein 267 n=1 Tax=Tribolium madens TaxID=41895 RepID=UPI001CF75AB0|nr:transmembrane protein 267 [Tribolium madens]
MLFTWFHPTFIFNTGNYVTILLALVSVTGDYVVSHTKLHLFQALFDNATHASIGALSWLYVCINFKNRSHFQSLIEIGLCAGVASLIDIDHFISARSIHLKDATSLQKRPPLHCSTFPFMFCLLFLMLSYFFQVEVWKRVSLIVLTAFVSHHTRDATRRGFWFYPFGATPPIPYFLYVGLTCVLPVLVCGLHRLLWIGDAGPKFTFISKGAVI